jgi:hypothetical protein
LDRQFEVEVLRKEEVVTSGDPLWTRTGVGAWIRDLPNGQQSLFWENDFVVAIQSEGVMEAID